MEWGSVPCHLNKAMNKIQLQFLLQYSFNLALVTTDIKNFFSFDKFSFFKSIFHGTLPNLCIQCFFDAYPSLYLGLSTLYLSHDLLYVGEFITAIPEYTRVLHYLLRRLSFHISSYAIQVIAAIFFISFDKLIEVSFAPVCKSLFKTNDIKYI